MARRCAITGKTVQTGNNVSHANNKSRRRFVPNIQSRRLYSEALATSVRLRIAVSTLRTIEKHGGLDAFLARSADADLPAELRRLKQRIEAARGPRPAA
jgi:large subunit ribosomal protein L28